MCLVGLGLSLGVLRQMRGEDSGFCSLTVRVSGPNGLPLVAQVAVVDQAAHRLTKRTSEEGIAKFCGLGIKPVDVVVGGGGCEQITLKDVSLRWGKTRLLPVIYAPCWLEGEPPPGTACDIVLRFFDQSGDPLRGVAIKTQFGPYAEVSDAYGRIRIGVGFDRVLEGAATAKGFESERFTVPCSRSNRLVERDIELTRGRTQ
jgi:hypothetical protein